MVYPALTEAYKERLLQGELKKPVAAVASPAEKDKKRVDKHLICD